MPPPRNRRSGAGFLTGRHVVPGGCKDRARPSSRQQKDTERCQAKEEASDQMIGAARTGANQLCENRYGVVHQRRIAVLKRNAAVPVGEPLGISVNRREPMFADVTGKGQIGPFYGLSGMCIFKPHPLLCKPGIQHQQQRARQSGRDANRYLPEAWICTRSASFFGRSSAAKVCSSRQ